MKRRSFIAACTAASAAAAFAQTRKPALVGVLGSAVRAASAFTLSGLRAGLKEAGLAEGQDFELTELWAEGRYEDLPALARQLIGRRVALIFASSLPAALAAKAATTTIPVVFTSGADPVQMGLVASLNRPGGNLTGVSNMLGTLGPKRLELLRLAAPKGSLIAVISNPRNPNAETHLKEIRAAAASIKQRIQVFNAGGSDEISQAFAALVRARAGALLVADDPRLTGHRTEITGLAAKHKLSAIYYDREFVASGGLMSYGANLTDNTRMAGAYVGRILKGMKPSDLPVLQPTKFEFVINRKTATALGIKLTEEMLLRATEVIE